jgi:hypothetical protein
MAAAGLSPAAIQIQIDAVTGEIANLTAELKGKKVLLKKLQKERIMAEKAAEMMKAEEDKKALLSAIAASGKSIDEILEMLN